MFFDEKKVCPVCGKVFQKDKYRAAKKYCSQECRDSAQLESKRNYDRKNYATIYDRRKTRKNKKKFNNQSIVDITVAARKEGMTYGQYVAKYGV